MFDWLRRLLGAAGGAVNNAVNTAGRFVQQNNPVNQWQQVQRQLPQVQRQIQRQIQPYIPRIQPPTPPPQLRQIQNLNIPRLANISADTARNVLGNIGKGYTNFAKQQEAKFRSDINLARNNPATFAVSKTSLLGAVAPFLDTSPVKLPKVDFTGYVDRSGDRIANTNVGRNPIVGFAGQNIVKPIIRSGARVADVMQGQEQYAPGIKGIAQLSTDAFNVGSLAYTPAKAGQLALGGKAALRVAPSAALRGAGAGAGISTLNQYADTGRINPTDVALSGLLGGVANVALPVAGGYAGRGLQRAGTAVKPVARELRLDTGGFAKLPGKNNPIDPLEALKAEARKYKSADEFIGKDNTQFADLPNYKFDINQAQKDFSTIQNLQKAITTDMPDATPAQRRKVYIDTINAVNKKYGTNMSTDINDILDVTRNANKYPNELAYESGRKAKTDLYNQAHAEAKTPQPTVEAKQSRLEQYGWRSETTSDGTKVYNRNGKHVATIKQGKNGRLTSYFADGEKMGSAGGSIDQYAEKIATQQFYAKKIEATPQNTGGTLRPDMKPIPTTDANKAMTADTDAAYKKQVDQRFAEADKRTKEMMAEMKWQKAREKFNTAEEYHLSEVDRLYKKYKNKTGYADSDIHRLKRRIINDHFDELDPETQVYFEHMAPGTDFENISKPSYRGFADASGGSGTEGVHASQIYELEQVVDEIRSADLYNQATAPQVGKTNASGNFSKGEKVGFAGILSPQGKERTGTFVRQVDKYLAEIDYGDHTELNHVNNLYKLDDSTPPAQVGKTTQATLKQANELVEPQATQLDRMGTVSAPQTLSKTGVDISSQADNTPISLKIKGQMSDANYLKRFGKERGAVKIKIKPFTPEDYAFERWKDRGALSLGRETLERNLDRVAGKDAPKVKKFLVEQSRNNEFQRAQFLNSKRGEVKNYIVDQLGIKPRSKESALVQKYGEGLIDDVQLNQEAGARAPQIAEAASYFRSQYDELLDQWNAVRTRYGYDEVPKRQDYFRHFKEINDNIMQLGMIPKSRDLPTSISGITDIFRPNKPFSNAELRRYTNETTFDAVGGFDNYLDSVSRQIFHTDTVQRGRYVENAIRKQAEDNPEIELPNFVANLGEWTNLVSGKKTRIDRASEQLLGRKVYGLMDALRRKTSANMVGANLSSAMSNFIPFTQSISTTSKPSVIKGMMSSATSPLRGDVNSIDGEVSSYLTRRFAKDAIVKVKGAKAADIASTPFKWVDEFTSRSIVAGKYYENLSKGLNSKEAMKAADDYASKVITDRSIGQLPNLMNTKTIGFITQFQAEINNQVSFLMRDIPELAGGNKVKIANMLGQFVVFSYLFNTGYEKVMGRRPQIDPIQAGIDMYQALNADNDDTTSEKVISGLKKAGDRIATGLPFVSVFTGGRLPVNAMLPDVPALTKGIGSIGSPEGTQWGQFYKGVSGPAFYGLPPFGGGQAKKTLEGLYSYSKGESTTPAGRQRFEVAQTPANLAKSLVFGQYSTDEGKQYIKQLGENQSGQGGGSKDKEYLKAFDAGERKFLSMTKKEQEEYLKQDQRFNGTKEKYRIWKIDQEGIDLPEGISDQSRDVLTQLAKTSERDKKAFKDKNLYAVELAEYEKDKLEGKLNDIEDGKRIKSLQRNKVYNDFDPLVRDLYSLNKTEFFRYIKNNPNGKALFAQAVALDDALVAIGLKSKLRNKYGQILEPGVRVARAKKGRSKKGGGKGRKGGVAKTGVVRLKSPKLRLSMSVVPPKVGKVSLKTSPKLRPASAKPVAKLSRVGSVKVRSNA